MLVIACGSGDEGPLQATIARERLFEATRGFELTLSNDGDAPVEVHGARLVSALFAATEPEDRTVTLWPNGQPVSFPLAYGPAECGGDDTGMRVALDVDGVATELDLGEAPEGIRRVHELECASLAVLDEVDIGFGDDWASTGPRRLTGTVTIDPRGEAEVAVEDVDPASVVFHVVADGPLPAAGDVGLVVRAARCDAHALIESKKLFTFRVWVRVGDGERVRVEVEARDGPARAALEGALAECLSGS
jgi:hypothetical protein